MKSVCQLTSSHDPFDTRIFHKVSQSLQQAGYDVSIVSLQGESTRRDGVEVVQVGNGSSHGSKFRSFSDLYRAIRERKPDYVQFHDPGLLPVGYAIATRLDTRVIYDVHEPFETAFTYYSFPPDLLNPAVVRLFPTIESSIAKAFDGIVAATEDIGRKFDERGHDQVQVVRNFPRISDVTVHESLAERDCDFVLAYVGGLSRQRGWIKMLECLHQVRNRGIDAELWLIGPERSNSDAARRVVNRYGLDSVVTQFGYVDYRDLFSYLCGADLGLALIDPETLGHVIPTKIFEYMYSQLPPIVTSTPQTRRFVDSECGSLVDFSDTTGIANVICNLLTDENQRTSMGKCARERVEKEFCWEREQERLLSFYDRLG